MAFKVPAKRRRDSSVVGSQASRTRTPISNSDSRVSTPVASHVPRHSQKVSRTHIISRSPVSRALSISTSGPLDPVPGSRAASIAASDSNFPMEDDAGIQDREDIDALNEIVMALDLRNRDTVGCSYYVAREEKLYLMGDVKFGGVEIVERRPWLVVVRYTPRLTQGSQAICRADCSAGVF